MHVIGAGVGRTGTYSLKLAVNQLGLGPCHHMEAVLLGISAQVPLWNDVLSGRPDWQAVYSGFASVLLSRIERGLSVSQVRADHA